MEYQMIVLDIDGTLTNSQKQISPKTKQALIEIQEQGFKVVLASGRPTAGVLPLAEELELNRFGNYILSFNGAKIIDCGTNKIIFEKTLPKEVIPIVYEEAVKNNTGLISYENDTIISGTKIDQYIELESRINKIDIKEVDNFPEYISFDVNKCLMTGCPEQMEQVEKLLKARFHQYLNIYRSEPFFLEIMPQNIDKANSLSKLLGSLNLTTDQMICCGDGFNDITMIEYAGLGIAMSNSTDIVKDASDYITLSNDEEGILHVINKFIFKTEA